MEVLLWQEETKVHKKIDTQKTLTMEQSLILLEKSKDTPIRMQMLLNVFIGLRRSEINGAKSRM